MSSGVLRVYKGLFSYPRPKTQLISWYNANQHLRPSTINLNKVSLSLFQCFLILNSLLIQNSGKRKFHFSAYSLDRILWGTECDFFGWKKKAADLILSADLISPVLGQWCLELQGWFSACCASSLSAQPATSPTAPSEARELYKTCPERCNGKKRPDFKSGSFVFTESSSGWWIRRPLQSQEYWMADYCRWNSYAALWRLNIMPVECITEL